MIKHFYTAALISFAFLTANAQVTLTRNSFPSVGDKQTAYFYDTTGVVEGGSGSGQSWDFSKFGAADSSMVTSYLNPATTPNGFKFPNATVAQTQPSNNGYEYSILNDTEYSVLGVSLSQQGGTSTVTYTNPQTAFTFPFTFNSVKSDDFSGTLNNTISPYTTVRNGSTKVTGDGSGKLILPGGKEYVALRTKVEQAINDYTDFTDYGYASYIKTTTLSYTWYISESKGPIMTINNMSLESYSIFDQDTLPSGMITSKSVIVYDPVITGVAKELLKGDLFTVSPNPVSNDGVISFKLDAPDYVTVSLKNAQGILVKKIYTGTANAGINNIDLSLTSDEAGLYFVDLEFTNGKATRKVIKK